MYDTIIDAELDEIERNIFKHDVRKTLHLKGVTYKKFSTYSGNGVTFHGLKGTDDSFWVIRSMGDPFFVKVCPVIGMLGFKKKTSDECKEYADKAINTFGYASQGSYSQDVKKLDTKFQGLILQHVDGRTLSVTTIGETAKHLNVTYAGLKSLLNKDRSHNLKGWFRQDKPLLSLVKLSGRKYMYDGIELVSWDGRHHVVKGDIVSNATAIGMGLGKFLRLLKQKDVSLNGWCLKGNELENLPPRSRGRPKSNRNFALERKELKDLERKKRDDERLEVRLRKQASLNKVRVEKERIRQNKRMLIQKEKEDKRIAKLNLRNENQRSKEEKRFSDMRARSNEFLQEKRRLDEELQFLNLSNPKKHRVNRSEEIKSQRQCVYHFGTGAYITPSRYRKSTKPKKHEGTVLIRGDETYTIGRSVKDAANDIGIHVKNLSSLLSGASKVCRGWTVRVTDDNLLL